MNDELYKSIKEKALKLKEAEYAAMKDMKDKLKAVQEEYKRLDKISEKNQKKNVKKYGEYARDYKKFSFSNMAPYFDDHIHKSIRGYDHLRDDVEKISQYFITPNSSVYDLGCSEGTMIRRIMAANTDIDNVNYFGVEGNPTFLKHFTDADLRGKKKKIIKNDTSTIMINLPCDVRNWKAPERMKRKEKYSSFMVSMFTLQFIPEADRERMLDDIFNYDLIKGGGFVLCEKVFSPDAKFQNMMDFMYMGYKRQFFSEEELLDKEQVLRKLAKLDTEETIINNLKKVGFKDIQVFWRNFNFIGLIAIKKD